MPANLNSSRFRRFLRFDAEGRQEGFGDGSTSRCEQLAATVGANLQQLVGRLPEVQRIRTMGFGQTE